jgi:hypothetical protein
MLRYMRMLQLVRLCLEHEAKEALRKRSPNEGRAPPLGWRTYQRSRVGQKLSGDGP